MFRLNGMKARIAGAMLALAALLIVSLMSFQYMLAQALYTETENKLTVVSRKAETLTESRITAAYDKLRAASLLVSGDKREAMSFIRQRRIAGFQYFGVVSVNGSLIYGESLPKMDLSLLQDTFRGNNRIQFMKTGAMLEDQQSVLLSVPLWDGNTVAGAVYGVLSGKEMTSLFIDSASEDGGISFCSSRDYDMIRPTDQQTAESQAAAFFYSGANKSLLDELYKKLYYKGYGVERFDCDGEKYYIASVSLENMDGWYLNYVVSAAYVGKTLEKLRLAALAAYFLLSLLLFAAFAIIGWSFWKNQQQIMRLAYVDDLTGMAKGTRMNKDWETLCGGQRRLLALLDFDDFSTMNSIMGYSYCNELLQHVAELFQSAVFPNDKEMAYRIRADRFALCICNTPDSMSRLKKLIMRVHQDIDCYPVSLSCGVRYMKAGKIYDQTVVYEQAVMALKQAKKQADRGTITCYNHQIREANAQTKQLETDFQRALVNHEFELFLQPKHQIQSDDWDGSEALVRWHHPTLGLLSPGVFIPLFEKTGDIRRLDLYMLEETCRTLKKWLAEGKVVHPISVNLSRVHLASRDLQDRLLAVVEKYQVPLQYLELEVTESAFFEDTALMIGKLKQLHEAGFRLAIDDFGTGYSNLAVLSQMPAQVLKLDKSFLLDYQQDKESCVLPDIVRMARHLGMEVILEGVETEEQLYWARQCGCDIVQGYYYAKPMSVPAYEDLIYGGNQK